jgi:hypothetical protein
VAGVALLAWRATPTEAPPIVTAEHIAQFDTALASLPTRPGDGRALVELGSNQAAFAMQGLVGLRGSESLTIAFREASPSAYFTVPLRNRYSESGESFGIHHNITAERLLRASSAEQQSARLELYDVRRFVMQSPRAKAFARDLHHGRRDSPRGTWEVYTIETGAPGLAIVPNRQPVLTFATLRLQGRDAEQIDFVRVNEELFVRATLEAPLVLSTTGKIDAEPDPSRFRIALVLDYDYDEIDRAFATLESIARSGAVVALDTGDPLAQRLVTLASELDTVRIVRPQSTSTATVDSVLDAVEQVAMPLDTRARVVAARLDGNRLRVTLENPGDEPTPVWIRMNYFPSWIADDAADIYLATPVFMLVFATGDSLTLRFSRRWPEHTGAILSLLGIGALLGMAWSWRRP